MEELLLGSYQQHFEQLRTRLSLEAAARAAARAAAPAEQATSRVGLRQALLAIVPLRRRLPA